MADAKRDQNHVTTIIAVLDSNGTTITPIVADPSTHLLGVSDGTTGSDFGGDDALRDGNHVPVLLAVSEVDGVTPVPLYANSSGLLMIDTN